MFLDQERGSSKIRHFAFLGEVAACEKKELFGLSGSVTMIFGH